MKTFKKLFSKKTAVLTMSFSTLFLSAHPVYALTVTERLLTSINNITYTTLDRVNKLPTYIQSITQMAQSWINTDDPGKYFATNQYAFSYLTNNNTVVASNQLTMTQDLTSQYLLLGSPNANSPSIPANSNELNYTVLFGQAISGTQLPKDAQAIDNLGKKYIQNLSGTGIPLAQPSTNWTPSPAVTSYQNYYNAMVAVKSLNTYMLGSIYKTKENDNITNYLITQSGNSSWFAQIATEPLGAVLRQILMYNSQIYVQLTRLVKLQQQSLAEQAATNSLFSIAVQQLSGDQLWQRAQMSK